MISTRDDAAPVQRDVVQVQGLFVKLVKLAKPTRMNC